MTFIDISILRHDDAVECRALISWMHKLTIVCNHRFAFLHRTEAIWIIGRGRFLPLTLTIVPCFSPKFAIGHFVLAKILYLFARPSGVVFFHAVFRTRINKELLLCCGMLLAHVLHIQFNTEILIKTRFWFH